MKKCLQIVEEHARERRLKTGFWCQMIDMADNIVIIQVWLISSDITALTLQTAAPSLYKEEERKMRGSKKDLCLPYSLKCVLSFSGGISLSEVFDTDMLGFSVFVHASPSNVNTAVTAGYPQSEIQWRNGPSFRSGNHKAAPYPSKLKKLSVSSSLFWHTLRHLCKLNNSNS